MEKSSPVRSDASQTIDNSINCLIIYCLNIWDICLCTQYRARAEEQAELHWHFLDTLCLFYIRASVHIYNDLYMKNRKFYLSGVILIIFIDLNFHFVGSPMQGP